MHSTLYTIVLSVCGPYVRVLYRDALYIHTPILTVYSVDVLKPAEDYPLTTWVFKSPL